MNAKKVLFINSEMVPYVAECAPSIDGRQLPQALQEHGCEIRTFMPRWGCINERRNQLHEVIRLSGMNIIIDDTDHPLIIKVASIPAARMQVYFIDNDDYFHKRLMLRDDAQEEYADNAERAIFYARGVLETVKKLRWSPDVIYCQGWIASVVPFYIKTAYREEPPFVNTKVVSAIYADSPDATLASRLLEGLTFRSANASALEEAGIDLTKADCLTRLAVTFSDAIIEGEPGAQPDAINWAGLANKPTLKCEADGLQADAVHAFIESL